MGAVYEATDQVTGELVAVKVLNPEFTLDAEVRRRFRRESSVLNALDHPCIVRILDIGSDEAGRSYTAMELLSGETLRARVDREGHLASDALSPIVDGMCSGLSAVHAHGVIHGDLKPANVFLLAEEGRGPVKLLDFGLSKILGLERLTRTGEVTGTPVYMAPELLKGDGGINGRVDTYALGVILFEALSGKLPFQEKNPGKLMFDIVMGKSERLEALATDVPEPVAQVVQNAMATSPEDRYEDAEELARAFAAAVGQ